MDGRNPEYGAKMVARAWVDPAYKQRALQDGSAHGLRIAAADGGWFGVTFAEPVDMSSRSALKEFGSYVATTAVPEEAAVG